MSEHEDIVAADDIAEGSLHEHVLADGTPICVFRFQGKVGAVSNICTHAEFLMSDGFLNNDGTLECGWHGARFDCRSGAVKRQPADVPLPVFDVAVENGRVLVGRSS